MGNYQQTKCTKLKRLFDIAWDYKASFLWGLRPEFEVHKERN
jgi:hypothetical protein